jgi:hypothetical protein
MLVVITALYRLKNLPKLEANMKPFLNSGEFIWLIVVDRSLQGYIQTGTFSNIIVELSPYRNALGGHAHRNHALHTILKDKTPGDWWIYFLDDDNKLHAGLEEVLNRMEDDVVVFDQLVRRKYVGKLLPFITRVRRADPNNIRVLKVDTAMFAFRYRALKGIRWLEHISEADGFFIEELKEANGGVQVVNKILCYYNWLQTAYS